MRHERQMEILDQVAGAGNGMAGLHGAAGMTNPASAYTDDRRYAVEQQALFRDRPVFMALSCELQEAGQYRVGTFGGVPIAVVRQPDGGLAAMVNACRHRGAPILDAPVGPERAKVARAGDGGPGLRLLQCPYHAWTYELDGTLKARPASNGAFDDVASDCNLRQVAVAEQHGVILVRPGGTAPIDVDGVLSGVGSEFDDFGVEKLVHVESRVNTWNMNWKLVLDTFTEVYHIRTLHRETIGPYFNSDCMVVDEFGLNMGITAFRKNLLDELDKPIEQRSILPYATVQYFVLPNALIVFQLDHFEVWRIEPIDVRTTRTTTSVYALDEPVDDELRVHLAKNLDVLLQVTGTEDFPLMTRIQANLDSGALPEVIYGRNEAALVHFHRSIDRMLAESGVESGS
jgi:phenylpropionate dioxygenase-like ring-hydroxylating dioxygenase large terminal subunit